MTKTFVSRTNGLELHIPADMGSAVRFFSVGEDARALIDDGAVQTRVEDPDQLKSELARAQARVAELLDQAAKNTVKATAPPKGKTSTVVPKPIEETESDLA